MLCSDVQSIYFGDGHVILLFVVPWTTSDGILPQLAVTAGGERVNECYQDFSPTDLRDRVNLGTFIDLAYSRPDASAQ